MLKDLLKENDVHLIDDRFRPYLTKSANRVSREENASSRSHQLRPDMPILEKQLILKSKNNKERMNKLIYDSIVKDHMFLKQSTENLKGEKSNGSHGSRSCTSSSDGTTS